MSPVPICQRLINVRRNTDNPHRMPDVRASALMFNFMVGNCIIKPGTVHAITDFLGEFRAAFATEWVTWEESHELSWKGTRITSPNGERTPSGVRRRDGSSHLPEATEGIAAEYGLRVWAWCLMSNHVHLFGRPQTAGRLGTRARADALRLRAVSERTTGEVRSSVAGSVLFLSD